MPKTAIAHKPNLTKEEAQAAFARHFDGKYRVVTYTKPFRDFAVEKNAFVGVAVKLEQQHDQTRFVYNAFTPRWWAVAMLGALTTALLGRGLTAEVREFIESAPEFH